MKPRTVAAKLADWKIAMAWQYFAVCLCDFILFPVGYSVVINKANEWHPLTLTNGGIYHMAMGAILGIASWQTGQEKITTIQSEADKQIATINTRKD